MGRGGANGDQRFRDFRDNPLAMNRYAGVAGTRPHLRRGSGNRWRLFGQQIEDRAPRADRRALGNLRLQLFVTAISDVKRMRSPARFRRQPAVDPERSAAG